MIFGKIKGYSVVTISKRKAKRGNFGEAIHTLIPEEKFQKEILMALEKGGRAFALYKQKELSGCYIVTKEFIDLEEYISNKKKEIVISEQENERKEKNEKTKKAYVLKYQYMLPEAENVRPDFEKAVLEEVKEMTIYEDVRYIAWKDTILVAENFKLGNLEIAGGLGMGLILGIIFGVALGNLALGMCFGVALGYALGTSFHTLWKKNE